MLRKLLAPIVLALIVAAGALAIAGRPGPTTATTPLDAEEQAFLTLINNYRQQNGLNTLTVDTKLQDASEWMSIDLGVRADHVFSHIDSLGRDPWTRMAFFGYNYNTWKGENLAAGTSSAQTAFNLWRDSPGHNSNMLGANFTAIGIARRYTAGSPYGWYWTTDFGGFVSSPMPPQSSATPTPVPTASPTLAPTASPTPPPTASPTPAPSASPTPAPTASPTPPPTSTGTPASPPATPSATATAPPPTPTATPAATPTSTPTGTPTLSPSDTPGSSATPACDVSVPGAQPDCQGTPAPTPTPTDAPPRVLQGDVDCSGTVTSVDALFELRYVARLGDSMDRPCSDDAAMGASVWGDVDCNNTVTAVDALKILRFVARLPVTQTEHCPDIGTLVN